jgi:hypothetical protein
MIGTPALAGWYNRIYPVFKPETDIIARNNIYTYRINSAIQPNEFGVPDYSIAFC